MSSITRYVAPGAPERLAKMQVPERVFKVPYRIDGVLTIRATDEDAARELAESKRLCDLAEQGELEMDDPEEVGVVQ